MTVRQPLKKGNVIEVSGLSMTFYLIRRKQADRLLLEGLVSERDGAFGKGRVATVGDILSVLLETLD